MIVTTRASRSHGVLCKMYRWRVRIYIAVTLVTATIVQFAVKGGF